MKKITARREARRWSRAELSRRSGVNAATLSLIESGRFRPYEVQLRKLARALGLPAAAARHLLEETDAERIAGKGDGEE